MMDTAAVSEKLVDSLRIATATAVSVITAIAAISVYLIQRSIRYFANPPDFPQGFGPAKSEYQIDFWGLQFGYETLTLVWPAVLGGLCYAAASLLRKRQEIRRHLQRLNPTLSLDLLDALDPLLTGRDVSQRPARRALLLVAVLPLVALFPHFISAALALIAVLAPGTKYASFLFWKIPGFLFVVAVLVAGCVFGFLGAHDFVRAMRTTFGAQPAKSETATSGRAGVSAAQHGPKAC